MIVHKRSSGIFVFLPWVAFWSQGASKVADYGHLKTALSSDAQCRHILKKFDTTVVRTPESRSKGLGNRHSPLRAGEAMLFVFESAQNVSFWMKDTFIPLELVFFDTQGAAAGVDEMPVDPNPDNPAERYNSKGPSIAALELAPRAVAGFAKKPFYLCAETLAK